MASKTKKKCPRGSDNRRNDNSPPRQPPTGRTRTTLDLVPIGGRIFHILGTKPPREWERDKRQDIETGGAMNVEANSPFRIGQNALALGDITRSSGEGSHVKLDCGTRNCVLAAFSIAPCQSDKSADSSFMPCFSLINDALTAASWPIRPCVFRSLCFHQNLFGRLLRWCSLLCGFLFVCVAIDPTATSLAVSLFCSVALFR